MFFFILYLLCILQISAYAAEKSTASTVQNRTRQTGPLYTINTTMGDIDVELFGGEAPKTVANFIGLAEGTKEFRDPKTSGKVKRPFYDGLIFHRVIKDFMIQGGCPLRNGTGGPGYRFEDEMDASGLGLDKLKAVDPKGRPHPILMIRSRQDLQRYVFQPLFKKLGINSQEELNKRRDELQRSLAETTVKDVLENMGYHYSAMGSPHPPKRGALAMANSGPDTNGSQFFINLVDTKWLTGKHTVFGRVVKGMETVDKIGRVPVDGKSRPVNDVVILSIRRKK
jgi:peptidyl-prolyl cis-trans isomerase A (cyclophilin A)